MAVHCSDIELVLDIAKQLFINADKTNLKISVKQFAGVCIEQANDFVEVYNKYKEKNKLKETDSDI
jgi:hypothetical protein